MNNGRRLELTWSEHQGRICLRVDGWTAAEVRDLDGLTAENLVRRLAIVPSDLVESCADLRAVQPMAGRFEIDGNTISFIPRFPFMGGMRYSLLVEPELGGNGVYGLEIWTIQRPAEPDTPATEVTAIFPTTGKLPVNQLRLYIHFSGPMSEGQAAHAVHVRRTDNQKLLEGVFLAMEPELWDPDRRRLTLLFDPGRIKRGLVPNEEAGYPLIEGVPINVTITPDFRDAAGRPLRRRVERNYLIGPPVRVRVNIEEWKCNCPAAGSTEKLTVEFDRPLDHALLQHSLWVNGPEGRELPGEGSVGPGERNWQFEPQSPWKQGQHQVKVDHRLEDLAGNSLIRVFDRDLTLIDDDPADDGPVAIDFRCSPPAAGDIQ